MLQFVDAAIQKRKEAAGNQLPAVDWTKEVFNPDVIAPMFKDEQEKEAFKQMWEDSPTMYNAENIEGGFQKAEASMIDLSEKGLNITTEDGKQVNVPVPFSLTNVIRESEIQDRLTNYKKVRKLTHDITHYDSSEKAVVDWFNSRGYEARYPTMLSPEQAHQLSKELGHELKYDKEVSEGTVRYAVQNQIQKRALEQELAEFKATGDYTKMQNFLIGCSALSGSVGAIETLGTIGLSLLGGQAAALGLAKWAHTIGKGTVLAKGIRAGQKAALLQKRLNHLRKIEGAMQELAQLNRAKRIETNIKVGAELIKKADFATKLGYDSVRFGMQATGYGAGWLSTAIPFAIDGMVSYMPFAGIKLAASDITGNEYSEKDALVELIGAAAFGFGMPTIGYALKGIPKVPSLLGKAYSKTKELIQGSTSSAAIEEAAKGHAGGAEVIETIGEATQKAVDETFDIAAGRYKADEIPKGTQMKLDLEIADETAKKPSRKEKLEKEIKQEEATPEIKSEDIPVGTQMKLEFQEQIEQAQQAIQDANLTSEELHTLIYDLVKLIKEGGSWVETVNGRKFKTPYLTKVSGMLNAVTELAETRIRKAKGIISFFGERGIGIKHNARKAKASLEKYDFEAIETLKDPLKIVEASFHGEEGALGRSTVKGLTGEDTLTFLKNLYVSRLLPDTKAAEVAEERMVAYLDKLSGIKQKVDNIIETYNYIIKRAQEARKGKGTYLTDYEQNRAYNIGEDTQTNLKGALIDLIESLLPEEHLERINTIRNTLRENEESIATTGRAFLDEENVKAAETMIKHHDAKIDEIIESITTTESKRNKHGKYIDRMNLKAAEGEKAQTSRLRQLSNQLKKMVEDNTDLLNSELGYYESIGDPSDILARLNRGEDIPELNIYFGTEKLDHVKMQELLNDADAHIERLNASKQELASLEGTRGQEHFFKFLNRSQKVADDGQRVTLTYIHRVNKTISTIENLLQKDFGEVTQKVINRFIGNEKLLNNFKESKWSAKEVGKIIKEEILDALSLETTELFIKSDLEKMVNEATKSIRENLKKMTYKERKSLISENTALIEDTAKEAADKILKAEFQRSFAKEILEPVFKDLGTHLVDMQNAHIVAQTNFIKLIDELTAYPALMPEIFMGKLSPTWLNVKGGSVSIENLSNPYIEMILLKRSLREASQEGRDMIAYASDPNNFDEIMKCIKMREAYDKKLLTPEQMTNFKANSDAAIVAKCVLDRFAHMQGLMHQVGSNKSSLINLLDPKRVRQFHKYIPDNLVENSKTARAMDYYSELSFLNFMADESKESHSLKNAAMFSFEHLDMDGHFNKYGQYDGSLNELRDMMLNRIPMSIITEKFGGPREVGDMLRAIKKGLYSDPVDNTTGLLDTLRIGSKNVSTTLQSQSAKYLDDVDARLMFKSIDSDMEAVKYLGYDTVTDWFQGNMSTVKNAYAILDNFSAEPFQYVEAGKEFIRDFYNHELPFSKEMSAAQKERIKIYKKQVEINSLFDRTTTYMINQICGTYSLPVTGMLLWVKLAARTIAAPMLMKAGFKSLTDYSNQYQMSVTMGLNTASDIGAAAKIAGGFFRAISRDRALFEDMLITDMLRTNALSEALLGESTITPKEVKSIKQLLGKEPRSNRKMNKFASAEDKASTFVQNYTDVIMNRMAFIGPLSDYNRTNAAVHIMNAIGAFHNTKFNEFPKESIHNFQKTLNRYGITDVEWDEILTKHCCMSLQDYMKQMHSMTTTSFKDKMMFFADNIMYLDDKVLEDVMKKQGMSVRSKEAVTKYRQRLMDKATLMVHSSADEMTALPTSRVNALLHGGFDPNSTAGTLIGLATQFQSFGVASWLYHFHRRFANHMKMDSPIGEHLMMSYSGFGNMAGDMFGMVSAMALSNFAVKEALDAITGKYRSNTDMYGNVDKRVLGEKLISSYLDQLGIMGTFLDTIFTGLTNPLGVGGGISIPVFPSLSSAIKSTSNIIGAGSKEYNEGRKAKGIAGQTLIELSKYTGLPNQVFLQALWGCSIGDWLDEIAKGPSYYTYKDNMYRKGYRGSWARELFKGGSIY